MTNLRRHVPELALEWAAEQPDARWRVLEGTLCFADISGFTALAERLAQHGRMGGEELVETLGGVFASMIGIARSRGGGLLKFGGDALLLFFQGPDHAVQAACAAVEMRTALREVSKLPTSVGPLKLSMSVGLHSAASHFFLVGTGHRELVILGPAANSVIAMESAAEAGEIVLSPETEALLPAGATRYREDGERLLRWRRAVREPTSGARYDDEAEAAARALFPALLGRHLADGAPDPEHRVACIAFLRFSGTDVLLEQRGPEVVAAALDNTLGQIQSILDAEGVTLLALDVDRDGGKLFLAAGIPQAHEDDEGVMLRALRRILDQELPLPLQAGVNRGHVFAAEIGDGSRAAYSAMGDTTNTAARLMARAPMGSIYAHPVTLDECQTLYEATPTEPLSFKGKAAPIVAYEVGAEIGLREREGLGVDTLIGRQSELSQLRQAIAKVTGGQGGGSLSLVGDTGLGKTRLLREATSLVEPILRTRGEPYGANSPYRMLRDPLRRLLGLDPAREGSLEAQLEASVRKHCPELLPFLSLLGDVLSLSIPPTEQVEAIDLRFRPDRRADVLIELLTATVTGPLTFLVDEAHWCDEASAHLFGRIEAACAERPWLLLSARRDVDQGFVPEAAAQIVLAPMSEEEIRTLVRVATDAAPLRDHEIHAVVARAGGYPLFAEEIIRASREAGSLDAVPESLEAAMAIQVDALDRAARRTLQFASVLGRSFSKVALAGLLGSEERTLEASHLERLEEFIVPEPGERFHFRSSMLRDTVYEGVAYRLRRRLHQAAGEELEARTDDAESVADALVIHFSRAGDAERSWRYGRLAGDRAVARHANGDAASFYELALDAARRTEAVSIERCGPVWVDLGEARKAAGMFDEAAGAYREALKAAADPLVRARVLFGFAKLRDRSGKPSSALRDLTAAEKLIADSREPAAAALRAELVSFRANVLFGQDKLDRAISVADQAVGLAEAAEAQATLAESLAIRESARTMLQGPGDGADLRRALVLYESLGELVRQGTVLTNLGVSVAFDGRWDEAMGYLQEARDRYSRGGNTWEAALAAANVADLLLCQGHIDEAGRLLEESLPVVRAARWAEGLCSIQLQLGHVLIEQGRLAEGEQMLTQAGDAFRDIGQPDGEAEASLLRASGRLLADEPVAALEFLDAALEQGGVDLGMLAPRELLLRGIAQAMRGELAEAILTGERGLELARRYELRYETGLLSRFLLEAGRRGEVLTAAEQASLAAEVALLEDLGVVQPPRSYIWEPT